MNYKFAVNIAGNNGARIYIEYAVMRPFTKKTRKLED